MKNFEIGTKNALFGYILKGLDFERQKDYCQHPQICQKHFSCKNKKTLNLGQKCIWVICRLEFWRIIVTFDVSTFEYVIKQCLCTTNNFKTWNQICLTCIILGCKFEKLLPYLKLAPSNVSKYKVLYKNKNS